MSKKRRQHSAQFKDWVGLDALKGIKPVHAIAAKRDVHPVQVSRWEKEVAECLPEVFVSKPEADTAAAKQRGKEPYEEIGRLMMELEWLKRSWRARATRSAAA